jgi:hypothetical protein
MLVAAAVYTAVALKTDDWTLAAHRQLALSLYALLGPITIVVFSRLGLYRGSWRQAGIDDFVRACCGVYVATLIGLSLRMLLAPEQSSLALFSIYVLAATVAVTATRASYQAMMLSQWRVARRRMPALIYGAGEQGTAALREMLGDGGSPFRPVAFIDDDATRHGRLVNGIPVFDSAPALDDTLRRFHAKAVVVATDEAAADRLAALGAVCERLDVTVLRREVRFSRCVAPARGPALAEPAATAVEGGLPPSAAALRPFETAARRAQACPHCGADRLQRSQVKTVRDRVRKRLTRRRLYRCEACRWRGWFDVFASAPFEAVPPPTRELELESLDAQLDRRLSEKFAS